MKNKMKCKSDMTSRWHELHVNCWNPVIVWSAFCTIEINPEVAISETIKMNF